MPTATDEPANLLVIDDNEAIHEDFRKIFASPSSRSELDELAAELFGADEATSAERPSFDLTFASQGKEGLERLSEAADANRTFGAAFVDMRMPPGWDGVETIEHLWKVDADLQVVICTAYSDRSWEETLDRLGGTDRLLILKKPFDEIEVTQLAASLTMKRQLLDMSRAKMQSLEHVLGSQRDELRSIQANAEQLMNSISNVLITLDAGGSVTRWNPFAEATFGIHAAEAIGKRFEALPIEWQDRSQLESLLTGSQKVSSASEIGFADSEGSPRTLDLHLFAIAGPASTKGTLVLANDITSEMALRSQLDEVQRQARPRS